MNKLIVFILTLLPVFSYSQVTSINIDTSASQVIIINNGTMIQNNGGTVNIGNESKSQDKSWENDTRCNWYSESPQVSHRGSGNDAGIAMGITFIVIFSLALVVIFNDYLNGATHYLKWIIILIISIITSILLLKLVI